MLPEVEQTDHGPKVVGHLLAILQDGPEEEVPPGVFAALLQLSQVLLGVEQSALGRLFLENIIPMKYYVLFYVGVTCILLITLAQVPRDTVIILSRSL